MRLLSTFFLYVTAVPITLEDVIQFKELALTDYKRLIQPDLNNSASPRIRSMAQKDITTLQSLLDEKQIIAGALWLEAILRIYSMQPNPKRVLFIRNSGNG